ncbi:SDR family NAD(P)-dependent oxidoreductase [Streptomyces sp. NBC_01476]|uniref:SDR family NAD(P)-dependent oxidoreductase n=1 Tax=Streptomyces sp. NBC_01476 TaxID=2903881 RepID=UPI003FCDEFC1
MPGDRVGALAVPVPQGSACRLRARLTCPADLSRHDECRRLSGLVTAASERLDILVNNAGAMGDEPPATVPDAACDAVVDLDLKSPFWPVQALPPALRRAGTADDDGRDPR